MSTTPAKIRFGDPMAFARELRHAAYEAGIMGSNPPVARHPIINRVHVLSFQEAGRHRPARGSRSAEPAKSRGECQQA
ncbi:MAG: hypothetical protein A3G25_17610 [Betaproteobacteria bacterium RIFCSPLOWO2_12_FULL_63_13]|nr:MAG: hypothetical protein A3G25_17610 [Betaproteobacteria bacterium RIFCSPLOWO2_12_FULL_63_13]